MVIRIVVAVLIASLLALHYRLWVSEGGMREVWRLENAISAQQAENAGLRERNRTLAAEVHDLKEGRTALEERARTDLGMVGVNETFFQVVPPQSSSGVETPPEQRTARANAG
jgi:cell division protein FtsB